MGAAKGVVTGAVSPVAGATSSSARSTAIIVRVSSSNTGTYDMTPLGRPVRESMRSALSSMSGAVQSLMSASTWSVYADCGGRGVRAARARRRGSSRG